MDLKKVKKKKKRLEMLKACLMEDARAYLTILVSMSEPCLNVFDL